MTKNRNFVLEIKSTYFTYKGNASVYALKGVSLNLKKGEVYALLGPNGAGKTTLVHTILGFLRPEKGEILFNGERISPHKKAFLSKLGFEPQENILWDYLTVKEYLEIMGILYGVPQKFKRKDKKSLQKTSDR